jgi:hypothetical protein
MSNAPRGLWQQLGFDVGADSVDRVDRATRLGRCPALLGAGDDGAGIRSRGDRQPYFSELDHVERVLPDLV